MSDGRDDIMLPSVIKTSESAISIALIINGIGAIALLFFIGQLINSPYARMFAKNYMGTLSNSILLFAVGTLAPSVAGGTNYLAQGLFSHRHNVLGHMFNGITIALLICSYILFGYATTLSYFAFKNF